MTRAGREHLELLVTVLVAPPPLVLAGWWLLTATAATVAWLHRPAVRA